MNYYEIKCKLGHSGSGNYREISFTIAANGISEAMDKAKSMPGVKHNANDVILGINKISRKQYIQNREISAYEPFKKEEG